MGFRLQQCGVAAAAGPQQNTTAVSETACCDGDNVAIAVPGAPGPPGPLNPDAATKAYVDEQDAALAAQLSVLGTNASGYLAADQLIDSTVPTDLAGMSVTISPSSGNTNYILNSVFQLDHQNAFVELHLVLTLTSSAFGDFDAGEWVIEPGVISSAPFPLTLLLNGLDPAVFGAGPIGVRWRAYVGAAGVSTLIRAGGISYIASVQVSP